MICTRCKQEHNESTKLCLACKEYRRQYQKQYRKQDVNNKQVNIKKPKIVSQVQANQNLIFSKSDATIRFLSFFAEYIKVPKYWTLTTKKTLKKAISIQILKI